MQFDFEHIPAEYNRVGQLHAKAKAQYELLSESKKSVLAKESSNHEGSEATKERIARRSDIYKEYLVAVRIAREEELKLKYELDSLSMGFDYMRSMNSVRKKETELL